MSSGIKINDKCVVEHKAMRARVHYAIVLCVNDNVDEVIVEKVYKAQPDGDVKAMWNKVTSELPDEDVRILICDFAWRNSAAVQSSKIILLHWNPDNAASKSKVVYASTRERIVETLDIENSMQVSDRDEMEYDVVKNQIGK